MASVLVVFFISPWAILLQGRGSASPVIFDHPTHTDGAGLSCDDCHDAVETLKAGERAIPDHSVCESCHEVEDDEGCGICHVDPDNPEAVPAAGRHYSAFGHDRHLEAGLTCEKCHAPAEKAENLEPGLPVMENCQACHLSMQASLECGTCHDGETPRPADHVLITWRQDHGLEAGVMSSDCWKCHTQNNCDDCHQGVNLYGSPHPVTWKFNHFEASSFGEECLVCHETRETCTNCHRLMRPIPHELGPSFAEWGVGGTHVEEAKAFIETCISCHDVGNADPTCAKCHY